MTLVIPKNVGGNDEVQNIESPKPIIKENKLVIPAQVGGIDIVQEEFPEDAGLNDVKPGFFDFFTGTSRKTPETENIPEVLSLFSPVTADKEIGFFPSGKDLRIASGMLASIEPKDQMDIIKENDPAASFRKDRKGNIIITFGNGQEAVLNSPGFTGTDALQAASQVLAFIPTAKIANFGKSLIAKVFLGSTAAAGTQELLQGAASSLGAKDADRPEDVLAAAVFGGAAEAVVPAVQGIRTAFQKSKIAKSGENLKDVAASISESDAAQKGLKTATGVDVPLFQGQKTQIPAILEEQSFVGQLPSGTRKAMTALKSQNKAIGDSVESLLKTIAPDESIVTGSELFRSAAQRAIKSAKDIRREKTSKLFNESFNQGADVNVDNVRGVIDNQMAEFTPSSSIRKTLLKVKELLNAGEKEPTLRQLQGVKLDIDEMLNSFGDKSLGNVAKSKLLKIKETLLAEMDKASPLFREARKTFAKESGPVNKIQESIIGKIANLDDTQLRTISQKIFNPAETNPAIIRKAKEVIDKADPEVWNKLVRTELERRLGSVKASLSDSTIENLPGQIERAIFGNSKQRNVLMSGVSGDAAKNLNFLQTVLNRAKLGRPGGSQTAARSEIIKQLRGGVFNSIQNFIGSGGKTMGGAIKEVGFDSRTRALADILFDPTWTARMSELRKLDTRSPFAARAMTQLLIDAETDDE